MQFKIQLTAGDLRDLATAAVFTSGDKSREILTGVFLEFTGDTITATATDSYRLVVITRTLVEAVTNDGSVLVPGDLLERVAKDTKKMRPAALITLECDEFGVITITGGDPGSEWRYGARFIEGKYPDVKSLIPGANGVMANDGATLAFNAFFLADFPKLAPWSNLTRADKAGGGSAIRVTAITDHLRPIRLESGDGRTVIVIMPVRL